MQNKLISIIVGILVVAGVGSLVYATKKPAALPLETETTNKPQETSVTSNLSNTGNDEEDEDSEDNDDKNSTTKPNTVPTTPTNPVSQTPPATSPTPTGITLTEIAKHNSRTSCWSAVNGNVYDLTSWIPNHPGGEKAILSMCGVDGSAGYNGQHGGKGKPTVVLAGFKIGALAK